jgi:hypothetical protein
MNLPDLIQHCQVYTSIEDIHEDDLVRVHAFLFHLPRVYEIGY